MRTITKTVKHTYSHEEREQLGGELARAFGGLRGIESELDSIKASYKSKTAEAEARIDRLSTDITNGFTMREEKCVVTYRPKLKEKDYWLESDAAQVPEGIDLSCGIQAMGIGPVLTEKMTAEDFQQELIEAESKFDAREEIQLFPPTDSDRGVLVVGRFAGKWFSALRVKIGKLELKERLDSEQPCTITRPDAVKVGIKRVNEWAKTNLKEHADGFHAKFSEVEKLHSERAE